MQVTGVVQRIHQRGNATNILVDDVWYGCGFNGVPCKEGDNVSFPYTQRGNFKNVNIAQMVINSGGAAQPQQNSGGNRGYGGSAGGQARGGQRGSGGAVSKDDYWKKKEERDVETQKAIQFQAARNSAISVADAMLKAGILELGKSGGRKAGNPTDVVLDFIDTITARYYNTVEMLREGNHPFEDHVPTQEYEDGSNDTSFDDDVPF